MGVPDFQTLMLPVLEVHADGEDWVRAPLRDALAARFDLETRTEKLSGLLRAADLWMEASTDSVQDIQQALELARSLGAEVDPASLNEAIVTLAEGETIDITEGAKA